MTQFDAETEDNDQEHDVLVPQSWRNDDEEEDPTLSFEAFFGPDGEHSDPMPESCRTDPLQEAAAELALAQRRLDVYFARFLTSLTQAEVARLSPQDQEVVRRFRALPEREQHALRVRFSEPRFPPHRSGELRGPRFGERHPLYSVGSPARRTYDSTDPHRVVATCKRTGAATTAAELARDWQEVLAGNFTRLEPLPLTEAQLRAAARWTEDGIETLERMSADIHALRLVEPESHRVGEPPSFRAVEPSSVRAVEPPDNAALPLEQWSRDPVGWASAGARSCRWCREKIEDEFDHDFCEPSLPDELATHPEFPPPELGSTGGPRLGGQYRVTELTWKESIQCASCDTPVAFELVVPRAAAEGPTVSALTQSCRCGASISVAYSWRKRRVVGLRMKQPLQGLG